VGGYNPREVHSEPVGAVTSLSHHRRLSKTRPPCRPTGPAGEVTYEGGCEQPPNGHCTREHGWSETIFEETRFAPGAIGGFTMDADSADTLYYMPEGFRDKRKRRSRALPWKSFDASPDRISLQRNDRRSRTSPSRVQFRHARANALMDTKEPLCERLDSLSRRRRLFLEGNRGHHAAVIVRQRVRSARPLLHWLGFNAGYLSADYNRRTVSRLPHSRWCGAAVCASCAIPTQWQRAGRRSRPGV